MDPANTNPLMANIPLPNDGHAFVGTFAAPISWHEELIKVDDNINSKLRANIRFIHDSWTQNFPISPWYRSDNERARDRRNAAGSRRQHGDELDGHDVSHAAE